MLLIEWEQRLSPDRKERLSVGHLFTSGICALILAGMLDDNQPLTAIATVVGASAAVSLGSVWGRRSGAFPFGAIPFPPPPSPAGPPVPHAGHADATTVGRATDSPGTHQAKPSAAPADFGAFRACWPCWPRLSCGSMCFAAVESRQKTRGPFAPGCGILS